MTSTSRIKTIAGRAPSRSPYICLPCRRQASTATRRASPLRQTSFPAHRNASSVPFSERIRSKIWGTDAPPGQDNPYGAPGSFEQLRKQRSARKDEEGRPDEKISRQAAVIEQPQESPDSEAGDATTWEGMRVVGGPDYGSKVWDEEHSFKGFMENPRVQGRDVTITIIHRALVEVMTLKKANLPLVVRRNPYESTHDYDHAEDYENYKHRIAQSATFVQSEDGEMILKLEDEELERTILDCIVPKEPTAVEEVADIETAPATDYLDEEQARGREEEEEDIDASSAEEQEELELAISEEPENFEPPTEDEPQDEPLKVHPRACVPTDGSWRSLSLADPSIKFAVLKRVMQLTGRRIPDPDIASIKDSKALLAYLVKKPKPKKLVQTLRAKKAVDLPNVELLKKRYTPIDREKEIGRWKVIARELKARGLPVTGKGTVAVGRPIA